MVADNTGKNALGQLIDDDHAWEQQEKCNAKEEMTSLLMANDTDDNGDDGDGERSGGGSSGRTLFKPTGISRMIRSEWFWMIITLTAVVTLTIGVSGLGRYQATHFVKEAPLSETTNITTAVHEDNEHQHETPTTAAEFTKYNLSSAVDIDMASDEETAKFALTNNSLGEDVEPNVVQENKFDNDCSSNNNTTSGIENGDNVPEKSEDLQEPVDNSGEEATMTLPSSNAAPSSNQEAPVDSTDLTMPVPIEEKHDEEIIPNMANGTNESILAGDEQVSASDKNSPVTVVVPIVEESSTSDNNTTTIDKTENSTEMTTTTTTGTDTTEKGANSENVVSVVEATGSNGNNPAIVPVDPKPPSTTPGEKEQNPPDAKSETAVVANVGGKDNKGPVPVIDPEPSTPSEQVPHVMFNDLHYRRVCAPVHSSVLCMTIRYPFIVPLQNSNLTYASPFVDDFYTLDETNFHAIDGQDLETCRQWTMTKGGEEGEAQIDDAVQTCLEDAYHAMAAEQPLAVMVVFTKRRFGITRFFGKRSTRQYENMDRFFDNSRTLVFGASPTPHVTMALRDLFGECVIHPKIMRMSFHCRGHTPAWKQQQEKAQQQKLGQHDRALLRHRNEASDQNERRLPLLGYDRVMEDYPIFLGIETYFPERVLPKQNMTEYLRSVGFARDPKNGPRRKLFLVIEYPIAHVQTQDTLFNKWDDLVHLQTGFPALVLSAMTKEGRKELQDMGYDLVQIIPFDGLPQSFPSETHAFPGAMLNNQQAAIAAGMYNGWKPEYGTDCRGPVPPNSPLTAANELSRQAFLDTHTNQGLDTRWYGRTWEFANQLWWQARRWGGKGGQLDCTHAKQDYAPFYSMHSYFLQAMVDDHYNPKKN